jgi:hypothetical protein
MTPTAAHPPVGAASMPRGNPADLEDVRATIAANLAEVRARVARAARSSGRDPATIGLVAVSKTFGPERIAAAIEAGQHDFGENRVQEAAEKIAAAGHPHVRWHLVGHLQSNKARRAATLFACIHSVDSLALLERLDAAALDQGVQPELLIQVDLGHEPAKHGAAAEEVPAILKRAERCRGARVAGLMTLPPFSSDPEGSRPYFRQLRELAAGLIARGADPRALRHLSMGMSHDLEVAIEEGATIVRVGTAVFGARAPR